MLSGTLGEVAGIGKLQSAMALRYASDRGIQMSKNKICGRREVETLFIWAAEREMGNALGAILSHAVK